MTNKSHWLYALGSATVLLMTSVNAQPYPPVPYPPYAFNPYNPYPGNNPSRPYWQPDREQWAPPLPPGDGYAPPPPYWEPPNFPARGLEERNWRPEPPPPWERPMPRRYPGGWSPPPNPYTGGYGGTPWGAPMPQWGGPSSPSYYDVPYPPPMRGFSPARSQPSNICH